MILSNDGSFEASGRMVLHNNEVTLIILGSLTASVSAAVEPP